MVLTGRTGTAGSDIADASPTPWSDGRVAAVVGVASGLLVIAGSWVPSLWGDEAASIMSARRDWGSLWALLGNVDAVHGLYYVVLHLWIDVFGDSPLAVRLPSGIAVGVASAGLYLLVRRRSTRSTALIAAAVFTVLPRVTFLGVEARSLSLATAAGVWLMLLMLRLLDGRMSRAWWWAYAVGLGASVYLHLYLVLLIPVHAIVAALDLRGSGRVGGIGMRRFVLAWAGAAVLAAPILLLAVQQREQIDFDRRWRVVTVEGVLVDQWFMVEVLALVASAFIVVSIVLAVGRRDPASRGDRRLLLLGGMWIAVPTVALIAVSALAGLGYTPRYLAFSAPGAAIMIAVAIGSLPRRWMQVLSVGVIAALAVPAYVEHRTLYWKNGGTDWPVVSEVVADLTEPGDGIVFDENVRPSRRPRLAMYTYPQGFGGLVDLGLVQRHDETDGLWDVTAPLATVVDRLTGIDRVVVVSRSEHGVDDDVATLRREGFVTVDRLELESDVVTVYERGP